MVHIYEFEIFEGEGCFLAFPFDMEGGTQGYTLKETCEMAVDWLKVELEHRAMSGLDFPVATFGNKPKEDGSIVLVAVEAGTDTVKRLRQ